MVCELHDGEAELCQSHIIPKFVFKWMKDTGNRRLRKIGELNKPILDGYKKKMLCEDCENMFSKEEKWFYENVFIPYLADNNISIKNTTEIQYFTLSILWRILKFFKDDGHPYRFKKELDEADIEWRNYLLSKTSPPKGLHFILIDDTWFTAKENEFYLARHVDIEIAEGEHVCFIYAKFARFILIGDIKGLNELNFIHTNIAAEQEFKNTMQLVDPTVSNFIYSRSENHRDYNDLSEAQQKKNDEFFKDKMNELSNSEYLRILRKYKP